MWPAENTEEIQRYIPVKIAQISTYYMPCALIKPFMFSELFYTYQTSVYYSRGAWLNIFSPLLLHFEEKHPLVSIV